jgi:hypothetical protein
MNAITRPEQIELDPIELDPRQCELCGLTIDRHEMVDDGDGPLFFCAELSPEMTLPELERRAELRLQKEVAALVERMERADPRDAWRHTGEPPPPIEVRNGFLETAQPRAPEPYRTPQSVVAAFKYVASLNDAEYLARWLANRSADAAELFKLWKAK